jgi:hypothetical protein
VGICLYGTIADEQISNFFIQGYFGGSRYTFAGRDCIDDKNVSNAGRLFPEHTLTHCCLDLPTLINSGQPKPTNLKFTFDVGNYL